MAEIILRKGRLVGSSVLVDDDLYEKLNAYTWTTTILEIVIRQAKKDGKIRNLPMYAEVLGCEERLWDRTQCIEWLDGNKLNCQRDNLRLLPMSQKISRLELEAKHHNSTGYKGVSPNRSRLNPFKAQIRHDGKVLYLGCFPTPDKAHQAYLHALETLKLPTKELRQKSRTGAGHRQVNV
jgi:hypothetical protein